MKFSIIILSFFFFLPVVGWAQVKKLTPLPKAGKGWLLWYQGKRQNDSVLIANNGAKITYLRTQHKVEVKNSKEPTVFQQITAELNKSRQRKIEMVRRIAGDKPDPSDLPMIRQAIINFNEVENEYRAILNTIVDIPDGLLPADTITKKNHGPFWEEEMVDQSWQDMFAEINAEMKTLPDPDKVNLGVPPDIDLSACLYCDSMANKRMDDGRKAYLNTLKKEEEKVAQKILRLFRVFDTEYDTNKGVRSPEIQAASEVLLEHLRLIHSHVIKKLERLIALYKHDVLKAPIIMQMILGINRQIQLMGLGEDLMRNIHFSEILNGKDVKAYVDKLMAEQDYEHILNFAWVVSVERHLALMGEPPVMENLVDVFMNFNTFKLTVSIDMKQQSDDHMTKGMLKSEETYYKALPVGCKFIFVQSYNGKTKGVGQPFLKFKLLQAEQTKCSYAGNKDWVEIDPYIKIGFCDDDDSIRLFPLIPNLMNPEEKWVCEEGEDHLVNIYADAFENNNNMVDENAEMVEKLQEAQQFTAQLATAEAAATEEFVALDHGYGLVKTIKEQFAQNAMTIIPVKAMNKSTVLFDKLYNGKLYTANENIVYANLWVKLEHVKN